MSSHFTASRLSTRVARLLAAAAAFTTAALILWACSSSASDEQPDAADGVSPGATAAADGGAPEAGAALSYSFSRYVRSANQAVGLVFDTRGRLLYAEKDTGRIVRYHRGSKRTLARLGVVSGGETGLLGLAVDSAGNVYAHYTGASADCPNPVGAAGGGSVGGHCVWRLKPAGRGSRLVADGLVFSTGHPSPADNHVGGGLHIGPDGALYLSLGDLGENGDPDNGPGRAQALDVPYGKILRLDPARENRAAAGNPSHCGNADNSDKRKIDDRRIWACGLRNTYGFAFDSDGDVWGSEAGDSCDEINKIAAGVNYGWQPPRTDCAGSGAGAPVLKLTGKTPSGIAIPTARSAGAWRNDVFYCAFTDGGKLMRFDQRRPSPREVGRARGRCTYDLAARGNRLYLSSGDAIYRLTIRR